MRRQQRLLLRSPEQVRVRGLLRPPERRLRRDEGRVQLSLQVRLPERAPLRPDKWTPERGQVSGPERGQEGPPGTGSERRLLRALERGSV